MAKYVCDIEQISTNGDSLIKISKNMNSSLNTYSNNIVKATEGWTEKTQGSKQSFENLSQASKNNCLQAGVFTEALGNHIKNAAKSISDLEESLASLSI